MGNFNSGNRREKKDLENEFRKMDSFHESYKVSTLLTVTIDNSIKQEIIVAYNDRKRHGGKVKYFLCPVCDKRARFLYLKNSRLACRTCQELTYESSQKKNYFNSLAKLFSGSGIDPNYAKSFFRPGKK